VGRLKHASRHGLTHTPPPCAATPHPALVAAPGPLHRHITPGGMLSACWSGSAKRLGAQTISIIAMRPSPTPHPPAPQPTCWQQPTCLMGQV
jgi:hypothetical protein